MKVIIPVAGYGTRLKPHTDFIQKTLLPVAGKPGLDHILDHLSTGGIRDIVLIIGHLGDQVIQHCNQRRENFTFIEQQEKLGLGHAVLQGLENRNDPVLIHLGDTIFNLDFQQFCSGNINRIAVGTVADPSRFGIVELEGKSIIRFHEKVPDPPTNLAISGLYYFSNQNKLRRAIISLVQNNHQTRGEYQLTDAMETMLKDHQPFEAEIINQWHDIGVPETFLSANRALLEPDHGQHPDCELVEPVFIGNDCNIKHSRVGPNVTIMNQCIIENCEIEDSIILEGSELKNLKIKGQIVGGDGEQTC